MTGPGRGMLTVNTTSWRYQLGFPYPNELGLNSVLSLAAFITDFIPRERNRAVWLFCLVCVPHQKQPHPAGTIVILLPRLLSLTLHMCCRYTVILSFNACLTLSTPTAALTSIRLPCYLILIISQTSHQAKTHNNPKQCTNNATDVQGHLLCNLLMYWLCTVFD